jgi:pimeloyl-ACP methyl ester carboxylesterase
MEQRVVTANGVQFSYFESGPADGPLALCLHGFPDSAYTWRFLLPELGAAGFHAVAPFLRGYAPLPSPRTAATRSVHWPVMPIRSMRRSGAPRMPSSSATTGGH